MVTLRSTSPRLPCIRGITCRQFRRTSVHELWLGDKRLVITTHVYMCVHAHLCMFQVDIVAPHNESIYVYLEVKFRWTRIRDSSAEEQSRFYFFSLSQLKWMQVCLLLHLKAFHLASYWRRIRRIRMGNNFKICQSSFLKVYTKR